MSRNVPSMPQPRGHRPQPEGSRAHTRALIVALLLLFVISITVAVRYSPPAARAARTAGDEFSGARAREILRQLVGDSIPHPAGSAQNGVVRRRILGILQHAGYAPEMQTAFVCNEWGVCAGVSNILARLEGPDPGAILLSAHYDSVGAGPGASDDGAGVAAILEIARLLKYGPRHKHPIIILIDDGEEAGLLGAEAFVQEHRWAREVRADVNLEARGTSGPSLMFETGSANAWLMRLYARAVPRPMTSSIYYDAYRQLPNDTDFSVFRRRNYQGFNFAYIGNVAQYHTALDNFADADPGSLQHHGDNALAVTGALADSDLDQLPAAEAVFFDLFSAKTIWWPATYTCAVAIAALLLLLKAGASLCGRRLARPGGALWGALGWITVVAGSALLSAAMFFVLRRLGASPGSWSGSSLAHPLPALTAFCGLPFAVLFFAAGWFTAEPGPWSLWLGIWLLWGLLSLVTACVAPAESFPCVLPVCCAALAGLLLLFPQIERGGAVYIAMAPLVVAAITGVPALWFIPAALGWVALPGISLLLALILTAVFPFVVLANARLRRSLAAGAGAVTIFGAVLTAVLPAFSARSPERMNIVYRADAAGGNAQWLVFPDSLRLPKSFRAVAAFAKSPQRPDPWASRGFAASAPWFSLPAPELRVHSVTYNGTNRTYIATLLSPRGALSATMMLPPGAQVPGATMQGVSIPQLSRRALAWYQGWRSYSCVTLPPEGVRVTLTLAGREPAEAYIFDETPGLPPGGQQLQQARPASATASQDGDETMVVGHVVLQP